LSADSSTLGHQEAPPTPSGVAMLIRADFESLPEPSGVDHRFAAWPNRASVLDAVIAAYNQARPDNWLAASVSSSHLRRRLEALHLALRHDCQDPDLELVQLVAHATLAMRSSDLHCSPRFSSNYLGWLIANEPRLHQWAEKGRALAEQGAKVAEQAVQPRRIYRDFEGRTSTRGAVMKLAINVDPKTAGEREKKWALENFGNDESEAGNLNYLLEKWGMLTC
jgi:hypothetical protein